MSSRPPLALVIVLLSFPQVVETIYSPALPLIASRYRVAPEEVAQTLSLWFLGFALGVVVWGRLCDVWGRRPSLLAGLLLYAIGAGWALIAPDFSDLLAARLLSAFGAAVGSIVTQTALRDSYSGPSLGRVFSLLGMALAISPAVGMFTGEEIAAIAGHEGIFAALGLLAVALLVISLIRWPETLAASIPVVSFRLTLWQMLFDKAIWRSAMLICCFNLAIFGYYQLGPFLFARLENVWIDFGHSGIVLAVASLAAAIANSQLLRQGWSSQKLTRLGIVLLVLGAGFGGLFVRSPALLLGMAVIAAAYAIAIPNILSQALRAYTDRLGTAGAILSLFYYNLLGGGLVLAGLVQSLDLVLIACAGLAVLTFFLSGRWR
ncbi:MFS transporter [Rhizobium sp. BR 314]|uniref:MFS transporter n=1 Tax=Rhizobium sp. BR 314 TaxID=3040013 RepID=UPI0039BFC797